MGDDKDKDIGTGTAYGDESKKRLFVCCDGTWEDAANNKSGCSTNVARFARCVSRLEKNGFHRGDSDKEAKGDHILQLVWYSAGIGTKGPLPSLLENWAAMTSEGINQDILNAYYFLSSNYNFGYGKDEIILVGYSRGAFTVRCLAEFISKVGLLRRVALPFIRLLFDHWNEKDDTKLSLLKQDLGEHGAKWLVDVPIKVLAEFDPVSATLECFTGKGIALVQDSNQVPSKVDNAFLAMALNEKRSMFKPMVWKSKVIHQNVKQCAFFGCHGDIGGGEADSGLSQLPLLWMIAQVQQATKDTSSSTFGAQFDEDQLFEVSSPSSVDIESNGSYAIKNFSLAKGNLNNSMTCQWKVVEYLRGIIEAMKHVVVEGHEVDRESVIKECSIPITIGSNSESASLASDDDQDDDEPESAPRRHGRTMPEGPDKSDIGRPTIKNIDDAVSGSEKGDNCLMSIHFSVNMLSKSSELTYCLDALSGHKFTTSELSQIYVGHWTYVDQNNGTVEARCFPVQVQLQDESYLFGEWIKKAEEWWTAKDSEPEGWQYFLGPSDLKEKERAKALVGFSGLLGLKATKKEETLVNFFSSRFSSNFDCDEEFVNQKHEQQRQAPSVTARYQPR